MLRSTLLSLALAFAALAPLAGCDDSGASPCEEAHSLLCQRACDCRSGEGCAARSEGDGGAVTISFDNLADCRSLYITLGCSGGGDDKIDFPACTTALEAATCQDPPDAEGGALILPAVCDAPDDAE